MSLKRGKPWEVVGSKVELFTELNEKVSKKDSVEKRRKMVVETMRERGTVETVEGGFNNGGSAAVAFMNDKIVRKKAAGR